jgi:hypothetical protein
MVLKKIKAFVSQYNKYGPLLFFILGFVWDSLTLGRIDRLYDISILTTYLVALSFCLYAFNRVDDNRWKGSRFERFEKYLPLAIQFFLGGLSSAYVIYFSRSVSLSKTAVFFLFLVVLLLANELLKKRISNIYLQFGAYFFVSFTYFSFMIPVLIKVMNTYVFILSGIVSLGITIYLLFYIYKKSPSSRKEIRLPYMMVIIFLIYTSINTFYYFNMIPPVPLALQKGMAAHNIQKEGDKYLVTYEPTEWYKFWRNHKENFIRKPNEEVYVFSSIFAPTALKKTIAHKWFKYEENIDEWTLMDEIGFEIVGGREGGYRGYSVKTNVPDGNWEVQVVTEEGLVIGIIDFEVISETLAAQPKVISEIF